MEEMVITVDRYNVIESRVREAKEGPVAEVGVAFGGVVARLATTFPDRKIYAYDTFSGLPKEKWDQKEMIRPGTFASMGADTSLLRFPNVVIRKGIFPDTLGDETGFVVVHLDCDYYRSTLESLIALGPRMAEGGVILLDDWHWLGCPGVTRAIMELGLKVRETVSNQAEIRY